MARALAPLALAAVVMLPRLASPQFGLLDDGLTLQTGRELQGRWAGVLDLIPETGRFFPAYWLAYSGIAVVAGARPLAFFAVNVLLLAALLAILARLVRLAGGSGLQAMLASVLFAVCGPAVETFYTLSKAEPLQLLWIGVALLAAAGATAAASAGRAALLVLGVVASFLAHATKETSVVLVPISLGWLLVARASGARATRWERFAVGSLVVSVLGAAAYAAVRWRYAALALGDGSYTRAYALHADTAGPALFRIVAWLARDFAVLLPVIALAMISGVLRDADRRRPLAYALVWMLGWLAIYVPWPATFEYYLLPFALGASAFAALVAGDAWHRRRTVSPARRRLVDGVLAVALLLLSTGVVNAATDGRVQLTVDRANADLVRFLGRLPPRSRIVANMTPVNEYHFELPMHLAEIAGRSDLVVERRLAPDGARAVDGEAFVVTARLDGQPVPTVRIALHEPGVRGDNARLDAIAGGPGERVYASARRTRLLEIGWQRLLCPLAVRPLLDPTYCPAQRGVLDRRTFTYGWQVHRLGHDQAGRKRPT